MKAMNKTVKEHVDFFIKVYFYIRKNGLDSRQATDIQKALIALNYKNTSIEFAESMLGIMDISDRMIISEVANIGKCKVKHKNIESVMGKVIL